MAFLDFRAALCIHVWSQVLRLIPRPAWTDFQWTILDEKLYRWVQKMISMLIEICCFVLSDSITSPLIREL